MPVMVKMKLSLLVTRSHYSQHSWTTACSDVLVEMPIMSISTLNYTSAMSSLAAVTGS